MEFAEFYNFVMHDLLVCSFRNAGGFSRPFVSLYICIHTYIM